MNRLMLLKAQWHRTKATVALAVLACSALTAFSLSIPPKPKPGAPARGADELFWVPTLEQAQAMARVTGKPVFLMGYSLVGDGTTYTKSGAEYCTGVF